MTPPAVPASAPDGGPIALFERRTAADPRDHLSATTLAEMYLRRAESQQDPEDFRRAEKAARTALERQKDHPGAIVALARAAAGQGRADEARRMLDDFLDRQPRHAGALAAAFDLAFETHDETRAAALADRLLAVNEDPATLRRLAQMAELHGDLDRAVALYRRAAASAEGLGGMPAEVADYRRRAGEAFLAAGRRTEAKREFDAALTAEPHDAATLRAVAAMNAAPESPR